MDQTDIAILSTSDSDDLSNYFTNKEAGEECELLIRGKFLGIVEGNARISIEGVELAYAPDEEEPEVASTEPTGAEMVLNGEV